VRQADPNRCRDVLSYTQGPVPPLRARASAELPSPGLVTHPASWAAHLPPRPRRPSRWLSVSGAVAFPTPTLLSKRRRGPAEGRGATGVADRGPARGALKALGLPQTERLRWNPSWILLSATTAPPFPAGTQVLPTPVRPCRCGLVGPTSVPGAGPRLTRPGRRRVGCTLPKPVGHFLFRDRREGATVTPSTVTHFSPRCGGTVARGGRRSVRSRLVYFASGGCELPALEQVR
jgi:hypothetical protein